jgi:SAM-dependent methyltransferase
MLDADEVLARIGPGDRVLDVGGWACPFNRADWVLDSEPYETRGYYATVGLPASQGGDREHFTLATWVRRDICQHERWPFPDKFFDFSICSHTLEDVRDPLFVCSELIRVSKRGYIETPSRLAETCRGWESDRTAGLNHHRWLIDYGAGRLDFIMKWHMIHADRSFTLPPRLFQSLTPAEAVSRLFWDGRFEFAETFVHGRDKKSAIFREFVAEVAASERFRGLTPDDPFEDEQLRAELDSTRAQLAEAEARLAEYEGIGPWTLGLARGMQRASARFPKAAALVKPIARLGRSRRSA